MIDILGCIFRAVLDPLLASVLGFGALIKFKSSFSVHLLEDTQKTVRNLLHYYATNMSNQNASRNEKCESEIELSNKKCLANFPMPAQ